MNKIVNPILRKKQLQQNINNMEKYFMRFMNKIKHEEFHNA